MPTLEIATEVAGREGEALVFAVEEDRLTVAQLIERKVREEIRAWRDRTRKTFGLEYGEWNVRRRPRRDRVKEEEEVARALAAFQAQRFFVIIDGNQACSVREEVALRPTTRVRFLRVVALAGG